jgi:HSP20 family protein
MSEEKGKKDEGDRIEIDLGKGKISFEGIFKGLGGLIDMVHNLSDTEPIEKKGEIEGPEGLKGVYGFRVKTLAGKPVIDTFGNVKPTSKGSTIEDVREPLVDVFDEEDHVAIIAEMPGVEEEKIDIEVEGDVLRITASNKSRKYAKEVLLPCQVSPELIGKTYKNGMLEIKLAKEKRS